MQLGKRLLLLRFCPKLLPGSGLVKRGRKGLAVSSQSARQIDCGRQKQNLDFGDPLGCKAARQSSDGDGAFATVVDTEDRYGNSRKILGKLTVAGRNKTLAYAIERGVVVVAGERAKNFTGGAAFERVDVTNDRMLANCLGRTGTVNTYARITPKYVKIGVLVAELDQILQCRANELGTPYGALVKFGKAHGACADVIAAVSVLANQPGLLQRSQKAQQRAFIQAGAA